MKVFGAADTKLTSNTMMKNLRSSNLRIFALLAVSTSVSAQSEDDLGLDDGFTTISGQTFNAQIAKNAQVLVSLTPAGSSFDFLPYDYLSYRAANGQYHWGDITFRYREEGTDGWVDGNSAEARQPVSAINEPAGALAASVMSPTLPDGPLNITREWLDVSGDLGLRFTIENAASVPIELGSLGFPAEFNSIFTNRAAADALAICSLSDPYIGMEAGHIRVSPTSGTGPALAVVPLVSNAATDTTPLEGYRNLVETYDQYTVYGSQTFEGLYEWQVLTKAWAENEWAAVEPWNPPSSRILQPGATVQHGVRFTFANDGVRSLDAAIAGTGTPVATGVPGFVVQRGVPARLRLSVPAGYAVANLTSDPSGSLLAEPVEGDGQAYEVTADSSTFGRARLTITYVPADGDAPATAALRQTVHYHITKPGSEALADLGSFLTTEQWYEDGGADPFNRSGSIISYDHDSMAPVLQDSRVWIAGLSDEAGAGSWLAAVVKQAVLPGTSEQVARVEAFVNRVLDGVVQQTDEEGLGVRKSAFFYEPAEVPGYEYDAGLDWSSWTSWNKQAAGSVDRAYNYVHVAAAFWAMYRLDRGYPGLLSGERTWEWYLQRASGTILRGMEPDVGYNRVGLMGETVFGEVLKDLQRERFAAEAEALEVAMMDRAEQWNGEEAPFGSEMAWDSTGQEGVYYWSKYFGFTETATKTLNSVLGYMPTVPHWGWNGNARRYWDNIYGGKLQRIERQIHHYGSALNAQVALSAFRSNPSDTYLLHVGYAGITGPLSNIHDDGFASASFHSWPDTLTWDGYSGDYGPGFLGMALGIGTYVTELEDVGVEVFGGVLVDDGQTGGPVVVTTADPVRRQVFIGSLGLLISVDAGIISQFSYDSSTAASVTVSLSQIDEAPHTDSILVWVETTVDGMPEYQVVPGALSPARGGWQVSLSNGDTTVELSPVRN